MNFGGQKRSPWLDSTPSQPYWSDAPDENFDPAIYLRNFETPATVATRNAELERILRRRNDPNLQESADRLAKCTDQAPCGYAMCPKCLRHFRRWLVGQGASFFQLYAVSLVPNLRFEAGQLHQLSFEDALRMVRQRFKRVGLRGSFFIGGIDLSFNEHSGGEWPPHWQVQFYVIVQVSLSHDELHRRLKRAFSAEANTPRPVRIDKIKSCPDLIAALSYAYKPFFVRRVSYRDKSGIANTRKLPLEPDQVRELAAVMANYDIATRLLIGGGRRVGGRIARHR